MSALIVVLLVLSIVATFVYWIWMSKQTKPVKPSVTVENPTSPLQFIDEKFITDHTQELNTAINNCLQAYINDSNLCGDDELMRNTLGKRFPIEVARYHKKFAKFKEALRDVIIESFVKNAKSVSTIKLFNTRLTWNDFRNDVGLPSELGIFTESLELWDKLNDQLLIKSSDLVRKFKKTCNCVINYLGVYYPNPASLLQNKQSPRIIRRIVSECVDTIFNTNLCETETINNIIAYVTDARRELWPDLPDAMYRTRIAEVEYILKTFICAPPRDPESQTSSDDANDANDANDTNDANNIATTPIQNTPNALAGHINVPESDVTVKRNALESFSSFPF